MVPYGNLLQASFKYEGRTESHEQLFLHANREQQTKESMVVDGTSCCVTLECFVTSIASITWPVSLLTKWPTTICRFASVLSSNFSLKRKSLLQKFTRDFSVLMEMCAWVRAVFEDGWNILKMGTRASNISQSGHPRTASTERNKERVDEIVQDDRCVTVDTIARTLGIGNCALQEMIESLGYRKVCARWGPRLLTEDHKVQRKAITSERCRDIDMKATIFFSVLWQVTKACFTISTLKPNGRIWNGTIFILHQIKKAKTVPSAAKLMGTVFWDAEGLILAEFLEPGQTITAARYIQTLHKLRPALCDKRPGRNIIILHDNARPNAARLT